MIKSSSEEGDPFTLWNLAIASLIENLSADDLPTKLMEAIQQVIPFEHMMIFGYRPRGRPLELFVDVTESEHRKVVVHGYIVGGYLLDPFYHTFHAGAENRFYRLDEVMPDNFKTSEYNTTHYIRTRIFDEVVVYVDLGGGLTAATSLTRNQKQGRFLKREVQTLDAMVPAISAFIRHHWTGSDQPKHVKNDTGSSVTLLEHIQNAFRHFGSSLLTKRETEIMGLILRGHSSSAIGQILGISAGTVKIHRKHAYQKLSISSQSELFSKFLSSLTDLHASIDD
jgi:DNA-binding CsgD family transcriptional regulator